jgi:hypothetical protein
MRAHTTATKETHWPHSPSWGPQQQEAQSRKPEARMPRHWSEAHRDLTAHLHVERSDDAVGGGGDTGPDLSALLCDGASDR